MKIILFVIFLIAGFARESLSSFSLGTCDLQCDGQDDGQEIDTGTSIREQLRGFPGKRGAVGPQGPIGPKGDVGSSCDCPTEGSVGYNYVVHFLFLIKNNFIRTRSSFSLKI